MERSHSARVSGRPQPAPTFGARAKDSPHPVSPPRRTDSRLGWLLDHRRPVITNRRRYMALGLPIAAVFLSAIIGGLVINQAYAGDAWHGGEGTIPKGGFRPTAKIKMNVLEQGTICAAVASGMALVRFGVRNYTHPRLYGVFSFVSYVTLLVVLLGQVYGGYSITVITNSQANAFANQIYSFLGNTFNYQDERFATTFQDIIQVSDFWAFMQGPVHDFLLGSALNNQHPADRAPQRPINAPAMTSLQTNAVSDVEEDLGVFPWIVSYCNLRAVVREPKDIRVASLLGQRVADLAFTGPYVQHKSQIRSGMPALFASHNFTVEAMPSSFENVFGQTIDSWDVVGSTGIRYPGAGGILVTDVTYPECFSWNGTVHASVDHVEGVHGCIYQGSWIAEWAAYNGTQFQLSYEREINALSLHHAVDADTALVQLGCNVLNTLEEIQAYVFYTIEFMPSGQVAPMEPRVVLAGYPFETPPVVWYPAILGFYILCEELQDLIFEGWTSYYFQAGWLNVFDWLASISLFALWVCDHVYHGVMPELNRSPDARMRTDTFWTLALVQSYFQTILGMACFFMVIKGLKFTKNVPIMCNIGNTFSHALIPVGVLLFVVLFLLVAFAIVFQIKFSMTQMTAFDTLGVSMFSMFRGLLGDFVGLRTRWAAC
eukprot:TRINITY_DN20090_c0_g1_i14.p1 TRINITY_DN20090_c0_g1~~TRINITY_DN20090_c0_g1_i14.p1  ORF type:complete len:658 (-),score=106.22 TRINITY_DN20090_c0_g1_i14:402-2375(-)